jgi:hypothetical protein
VEEGLVQGMIVELRECVGMKRDLIIDRALGWLQTFRYASSSAR